MTSRTRKPSILEFSFTPPITPYTPPYHTIYPSISHYTHHTLTYKYTLHYSCTHLISYSLILLDFSGPKIGELSVSYFVEELHDESTYKTFCKDLEDANIFIGSLIFVEELALKVKAAVEKEMDRLDVVLMLPSMPEVMRLNKLGSFSMSQLGQSKSPFFQLFKKKKQSTGFADGMFKFVRTLSKVLKYLPNDKAQDARLYILSLKFYLGGSPDNLQNFLKMIYRSYVEALKGIKIEYVEPVLYWGSGIWHPLAHCMYDDMQKYLNW